MRAYRCPYIPIIPHFFLLPHDNFPHYVAWYPPTYTAAAYCPTITFSPATTALVWVVEYADATSRPLTPTSIGLDEQSSILSMPAFSHVSTQPDQHSYPFPRGRPKAGVDLVFRVTGHRRSVAPQDSRFALSYQLSLIHTQDPTITREHGSARHHPHVVLQDFRFAISSSLIHILMTGSPHR
jgi:hypothetical protein